MDVFEIVSIPIDPAVPMSIGFKRYPEFRRLEVVGLNVVKRHWTWGFYKLHMMFPRRLRVGVELEELKGGWAVNIVCVVGYLRVATFTGTTTFHGTFRPARVR